MQRLSGLMLHLRRIRQGVRDVPAPILGMIPSAHSSADDRSTPVTGPVLVRAGVVGHGPTADIRIAHVVCSICCSIQVSAVSILFRPWGSCAMVVRGMLGYFVKSASVKLTLSIALNRCINSRRASMGPKTGLFSNDPNWTQNLPSDDRYTGLMLTPPGLKGGYTEPFSLPVPKIISRVPIWSLRNSTIRLSSRGMISATKEQSNPMTPAPYDPLCGSKPELQTLI